MWYEVSPIPTKRRVRFLKGGNTYTDSLTRADMQRIRDSYKGRLYQKVNVAVIVFAYQQLPQSKAKLGREPFTYKPDADNILKCVMDALSGVAYMDDKQVTQTIVRKMDRTNEIKGEFIHYCVVQDDERMVNKAIESYRAACDRAGYL